MTEAEAIQSIRDNALVFGCDLSDVTDEEIIEAAPELIRITEQALRTARRKAKI